MWRASRLSDSWPSLTLRVVSSWIERRKVQSEKANLTILFDKYLPTCLDKLRVGFKRITPVPEITVIQTILYLLECLLTEKNAPPDSPKELYELYFVFACFWAFGGAMFQDQVTGAPGSLRPDPGHPAALSAEPLGSSFSSCPYSSLTIEWSSASGGSMNLKRSSYPRRGPSSTTTLTPKQRNSCPGQIKCLPLSWTLTSRCR